MASPSAAAALHRHQSSLKGNIDFSAQPPLGRARRDHALSTFYQIVSHFEAINDDNEREYKRPLLIRLTYEYITSRESRDNFLRAFFKSLALPIDTKDSVNLGDASLEADLRSALICFAEYLFENFFLPLKASTRKPPQPTPTYDSAIWRLQGGLQEHVGTPERISSLRVACLVRDRHRCVISRVFDQKELISRVQRYGDNAQDEGVLLKNEKKQAQLLEIAHILSHPLTRASSDDQMDPSKRATLAILDMFDSGVVNLIEGPNIDRPYNAVTLTHSHHDLFGDFQIFFTAVPDEAHTYDIESLLHPGALRHHGIPDRRKMYLTDDRTLDPPSPRLLAFHRAIVHILHFSAAGEYIDELLQDMDEGTKQDGSTELDRFVKLGLGGWLEGTAGAT